MALSNGAQPDARWDETQCKEALAQLERVQEHLDNLRLTMGRILSPLQTPPKNNTALYVAYKQAAVRSSTDLENFRTEWQNPEMQSIFQHTKQSFAADADLSAGAQVPRYGWQQSVAAERKAAGRRRAGVQPLDAPQTHLSKQEITKILEDFHKTYPYVKIDTKDDHRDIMIHIMAASVKLKFRVVIDQEVNGSADKLRVKCLGTTMPFTTITKCVTARPQPNNLKYLLDMIAAYKTVRGLTCTKCTSVIDRSGQIPTARRSKQVSKDDGTTETIWEAFHQGCLE